MRGKITDTSLDDMVEVTFGDGETEWYFRFRFDVDPKIGDIVESADNVYSYDITFKVFALTELSWKECGF